MNCRRFASICILVSLLDWQQVIRPGHWNVHNTVTRRLAPESNCGTRIASLAADLVDPDKSARAHRLEPL